MKGRDCFTAEEAQQIRELLQLVRRAEPGLAQKTLRDALRAIGFYISDWPRGSVTGFTASDFDDLVRRGLIRITAGPGKQNAGAGDAGKQETSAVHASERRRKSPPSLTSGSELDADAVAALAELGGPRHRLSKATAADDVPPVSGLYKIYGSAKSWRELGLGAPPDGRPLYVGKAEDSLLARDIHTHFGDGRTGLLDRAPLRRGAAARHAWPARHATQLRQARAPSQLQAQRRARSGADVVDEEAPLTCGVAQAGRVREPATRRGRRAAALEAAAES
jgi:hypothetical protein